MGVTNVSVYEDFRLDTVCRQKTRGFCPGSGVTHVLFKDKFYSQPVHSPTHPPASILLDLVTYLLTRLSPQLPISFLLSPSLLFHFHFPSCLPSLLPTYLGTTTFLYLSVCTPIYPFTHPPNSLLRYYLPPSLEPTLHLLITYRSTSVHSSIYSSSSYLLRMCFREGREPGP